MTDTLQVISILPQAASDVSGRLVLVLVCLCGSKPEVAIFSLPHLLVLKGHRAAWHVRVPVLGDRSL